MKKPRTIILCAALLFCLFIQCLPAAKEKSKVGTGEIKHAFLGRYTAVVSHPGDWYNTTGAIVISMDGAGQLHGSGTVDIIDLLRGFTFRWQVQSARFDSAKKHVVLTGAFGRLGTPLVAHPEFNESMGPTAELWIDDKGAYRIDNDATWAQEFRREGSAAAANSDVQSNSSAKNAHERKGVFAGTWQGTMHYSGIMVTIGHFPATVANSKITISADETMINDLKVTTRNNRTISGTGPEAGATCTNTLTLDGNGRTASYQMKTVSAGGTSEGWGKLQKVQ